MLLLLACVTTPSPAGDRVDDATGWYRTFGSVNADEGWGLAAGDDRLYVGTLEGNPQVLPDAWLHVLDGEGEELASGSVDGSGSSDMVYVVEAAGDVVYLGGASFHGLGTEDADAMLLALDSTTGAELGRWIVDGFGAGYDEIDGIVVTDEVVYFTGWTRNANGDMDALTGGADPASAYVVAGSWGGGGWDEANGHLVADGQGSMWFGGVEDGDGLASGGSPYLARWSGALNNGSPNALETWSLQAPEGSSWVDVLGVTTDPATGLVYAVGASLIGGVTSPTFWVLDPETGEDTMRVSDTAGSTRSAWVSDDGLVVAATESGDLAVYRLDLTSLDGEAETWAGPGDEEWHDVALIGDQTCFVGQTDGAGEGGTDAIVRCEG